MAFLRAPQTTRSTSEPRKEKLPRDLYLKQRSEVTRSWLRANPRVGEWVILGDPEAVKTSKGKISCRCSCGREVEVRIRDLIDGGSKSCKPCVAKSKRVDPSASDMVYQEVHKPLRMLYKGIRKRCYNPNDQDYQTYGGRGIQCLFASTKEFIDHVLTLPREEGANSIDRIDPNGHYAPGNIRWATQKQQCRNKREHLYVGNRLLVELIEENDALAFAPAIRTEYKKGRVNSVADILIIRDRNIARREQEAKIKRVQAARPDYCYETIRSLLKQGISEEAIIARTKWEGCGTHE